MPGLVFQLPLLLLLSCAVGVPFVLLFDFETVFDSVIMWLGWHASIDQCDSKVTTCGLAVAYID